MSKIKKFTKTNGTRKIVEIIKQELKKRIVDPLSAKSGNCLMLQDDGSVKWEDISIEEVVLKMYPIGSIYITSKEGNPKHLFPGTEWERFSAGRTMKGTSTGELWVSNSDYTYGGSSWKNDKPDFNTEVKGGAKSIILSLEDCSPHKLSV